MSRKVWILLLGLICIVGGALSVYFYKNADRRGPEIQFTGSNITYHEGDDPSGLLEGVTAMDDVDGDVSGSLSVEAIYPSADNKKVKVVYAAMDSSYNVTKKQRILPYGLEDGPAAPEEETELGTGKGHTIFPGAEMAEDMAEAPGSGAALGETEETFLNANITVVNGSGISGVAGEWQGYLEKEGYTSVNTGSYLAGLKDTVVCTGNKELARELLRYFPGASVTEKMPQDDVDIPLDEADACIVVGPGDTDVP